MKMHRKCSQSRHFSLSGQAFITFLRQWLLLYIRIKGYIRDVLSQCLCNLLPAGPRIKGYIRDVLSQHLCNLLPAGPRIKGYIRDALLQHLCDLLPAGPDERIIKNFRLFFKHVLRFTVQNERDRPIIYE